MQATHPSHSFPTSSACGHTDGSAQQANSDTSDQQFRRMTDAMPHIVWLMQADGSYTYVNQKWLIYTGLSWADSLQHGWLQAVHPDDRAR
jgi:PAS domain-containing protein